MTDVTYDEMVEAAEKNYPTQRGLNVYVCEKCAAPLITIDRHKGVTPFMTWCPSCKGWAQSSMYRVPQTLEPTHEWRRPTREEYDALEPATKQHCANGGLLLKEIING